MTTRRPARISQRRNSVQQLSVTNSFPWRSDRAGSKLDSIRRVLRQPPAERAYAVQKLGKHRRRRSNSILVARGNDYAEPVKEFRVLQLLAELLAVEPTPIPEKRWQELIGGLATLRRIKPMELHTVDGLLQALDKAGVITCSQRAWGGHMPGLSGYYYRYTVSRRDYLPLLRDLWRMLIRLGFLQFHGIK